jgi:hypothetical protein
MKKMGMILAVLVITMFFVGGVAAMNAKNPPDQREKFREDCAVQGVGYIEYEKKILDKAIAVDVEESMYGHTGWENGSFAMTITEILNEGVRLDCHGNCTNMTNITDPIYGDDNSPVMTNFECKKMVQFEIADADPDEGWGLVGRARYNNPGFHGGINAEVIEHYNVWELQKDELVTMTTTATYNASDRCVTNWRDCGKYKPYTANELNFDTKNAFKGEWGTDSSWKRVCNKDIEHHQLFRGEFQVDKNLMFKEEVTKPCLGKLPREGDC